MGNLEIVRHPARFFIDRRETCSFRSELRLRIVSLCSFFRPACPEQYRLPTVLPGIASQQ